MMHPEKGAQKVLGSPSLERLKIHLHVVLSNLTCCTQPCSEPEAAVRLLKALPAWEFLRWYMPGIFGIAV